VFGAAERLAPSLERVGYRVCAFFPPRATSAHLFADLVQHTVYAHIAEEERLNVVLGFFCAHGHDTQQGLVNRRGELLVEISHCRLFHEAVVACCSCLENEAFPNRLAQQTRSISAVVGYKPALSVAHRDAVANWGGSRLFAYTETLVEPLIQPIWSLLTPGCTVRQALDHTRDMWVLGSLHPSVACDPRLSFVW